MCPQPIQEGELPPHDALENVLPEYQYIFVDPDPKTTVPGQTLANGLRSVMLVFVNGSLVNGRQESL